MDWRITGGSTIDTLPKCLGRILRNLSLGRRGVVHRTGIIRERHALVPDGGMSIPPLLKSDLTIRKAPLVTTRHDQKTEELSVKDLEEMLADAKPKRESTPKPASEASEPTAGEGFLKVSNTIDKKRIVEYVLHHERRADT